MMAPRLLLLTLILLLNTYNIANAQSVTAEEIASLSISGWWSDCDYSAENSCAGNYTEIELTPLDPSGNTCYVNPHVDATSSTKNVVFWLGPAGSDVANATDGILLYVLRVDDADVETYLPTNCTDSGSCSCDSVDPLRDPWRTLSTCSGECSATQADDLALFENDCAVLYKESVINPFFNDTIVTCAIQGSLIDTSSSTPSSSPVPSAGEELTSGGGSLMKVSLSASWLGFAACIAFLALFLL